MYTNTFQSLNKQKYVKLMIWMNKFDIIHIEDRHIQYKILSTKNEASCSFSIFAVNKKVHMFLQWWLFFLSSYIFYRDVLSLVFIYLSYCSRLWIDLCDWFALILSVSLSLICFVFLFAFPLVKFNQNLWYRSFIIIDQN